MGQSSYPAADGSGVTGATYEALMAPVTGSGLVGDPTQSPLVFADGSGRQVKLQPSRSAVVRAYHWATDTDGYTAAVTANTSGQPRLDLCVLRLNRAASFAVTFQVLPGTPAATPVAPSPTQQEGSSGVWDLPVAVVRVTSSSTSGQPLIASSDVTALDYYLASRRYAGKAAQMPAATPGAEFFQSDTGKLMYASGTVWGPLGEIASQASWTAGGGWSIGGGAGLTRRNGLVYAQPHFQMISATAPNSHSLMATAPVGYRPAANILMPGVAAGTIAIRGLLNTDGTFMLDANTANLAANTSCVFSPITFPASA